MAPPMFMSLVLIVQIILLHAAILPVHSDSSLTLSPISPPPTQCEPFTFQWTGGTPPFFVHLNEQGGQGQRSLGPIEFPLHTYLWVTDFPAGTRLQANVSGLNSESEQIDTFTVQSGSVSICLGSTGTTSAASNTAAPSGDPTPTVPSVPGPSLSPSPSTRSTSTELTQSPPSSSVQTDTTTLSPTDSQTPAAPSSSQPAPLSRIGNGNSNSGATAISSSPSSSLTRVVAISSSSSLLPNSDPAPAPTSNPPSSKFPQQSTSHGPSKRGRVAGIIVGCLVAALLTALALILLRRRRKAKGRSRVTSMATLDTLAFTATTWSDLSTAEPGKPLGANKGVTEWNADLFARASSRIDRNAQSSLSIPFVISQAQSRKGPRITSLSTIPEASAESSMPSPVESDESAGTAQNLHSYPPLVPQTLPTSDRSLREHGYSPVAPPAVQVPVNPFRARLLAARSRGTWAGHDDLGDPDPFR
ncbi:hypothetical protein LXA43DRAFT_346440 [Ganoderma leucocontextum]|nr:hypothetical protein LXA43DRAFT_346440 [Ganoderma leucocontextum]